MYRKMLVLSLSLALTAGIAVAKTTDQSKNLKEMQKQATKLDNQSGQNQEIVFDSLSKQLNIPVDVLKNQQADTNFGPGQLFIANSLAVSSGKTFDEITQEFNSGKGWGEIANENDLNLGKVVSGLKRTNKKVEENRNKPAQANASGRSAGYSSEGRGSASYGASNASSRGAGMSHSGGNAGSRGRR
jgi:hypothetical protein